VSRGAGGPRPWYREPWVWFLISLPLAAVAGSMVTIVLALRSNDGLVVDDYYRHGMQINRVLARDRAAERHGLSADLRLDADHGVLEVALSAAAGFRFPPAVAVLFSHATRAGGDRDLILEHAGAGRYRGPVPALRRGRWHVQIQADDWRVLDAVVIR